MAYPFLKNEIFVLLQEHHLPAHGYFLVTRTTGLAEVTKISEKTLSKLGFEFKMVE